MASGNWCSEGGGGEVYAAVYGNFPMAGPWAGSGIPNQATKISPVKKTIIIATTKSQVALYEQLLFSPRASVFCYSDFQ